MARSRKNHSKDKTKRMGLVKIGIGGLVVFGFGAGMYFAGQARLFQSGETVEVKVDSPELVQKPVASKPKRAFGAVLADLKENQADNFKYTFFKVLDDSGLDSFVDLNGNIVRKPVSVKNSFIPKAAVAPQEKVKRKSEPSKAQQVTNKKTVKVEKKNTVPEVKSEKNLPQVSRFKPAIQPGESVTPQTKNSQWVISSLNKLEEKEEKEEKYVVQVASFKKIERAREMEGKIKLKGYFPFIRSIEIPGKGTWYRVYLGEYPSRTIAERYAEKSRNELKLQPVVKNAG